MTDQTFTDNAAIAGTRITSDGYLHGDVRCARVGCQDYLGAEMGRPDLAVVTVYRPASTVFDRASLATFAGKPVTVGHPAEAVTSANWKDHAAGDVGDEIARDGEFVKVPFRLMDATAIKAVQDGTREVSMGYSCGIEWADGVADDGTPYQAIQRGPLRINHLAIVPRARGGDKLRIGDAAASWGASPVTDAHKETPMTTRKIMVDGLEVETTDAAAAAITKLQGTITAKDAAITDAKATHDAAIAAKDAELATKDAEIDKLKASQLSDADLDKRVQARASLLSDAAKIAKDVATAGLSDADIRKAVVAARMGDKMPADASQAYIDARFQIFAEDSEGVDTVRDALRTATILTNDDGWGSAFQKAGVKTRKEA